MTVQLQISMTDLLKEQEKKIEAPVPVQGETVYTIPEDVWEGRCQLCVHKHAEKNIPIPIWAVHKPMYEGLIPCRIMAISRPNDRPGECMSFAPRIDVYGICASCRHNGAEFHEGFCFKEDHAPQRRVFYGQHYGGDEKKMDYYGRHRLSVCDDYEPDQWVTERRDGNGPDAGHEGSRRDPGL